MEFSPAPDREKGLENLIFLKTFLNLLNGKIELASGQVELKNIRAGLKIFG